MTDPVDTATLTERLRASSQGAYPCGGKFTWTGVQTRCERCDSHQHVLDADYKALFSEAAAALSSLETRLAHAEAQLRIADDLMSAREAERNYPGCTEGVVGDEEHLRISAEADDLELRYQGYSTLAALPPPECSSCSAAGAREKALREALMEARDYVIVVADSGWDSLRVMRANEAIEKIDRALVGVRGEEKEQDKPKEESDDAGS